MKRTSKINTDIHKQKKFDEKSKSVTHQKKKTEFEQTILVQSRYAELIMIAPRDTNVHLTQNNIIMS